jgi:hypothetical protein
MRTVQRRSPTRSTQFARGTDTAGWKNSTARRAVEAVTFHLRLEWLDDPKRFTPEWDAGIARTETRELKPGKQYRVQVQFLSRPTEGTSEPIYAESSLELTLAYLAEGASEPKSLTIAPDPHWSVSLGEAIGYSRDFLLAVSPNCYLEEGTLRLSCLSWLEGKFEDPHALSVNLRLAGSLRNEVRQSVHLALDQSVAKGQIMVHAIEAENNKLNVIGFRGYDQRFPFEERAPIDRPDQALAKLLMAWKDTKKMLIQKEFERLTEVVWNEVQEFSRKRGPKLLDWLFRLIGEDPDSSVVITDHTRFEVPWELIEVAPDMPLGALVPVARWTLVNEYALTQEQLQRGDLAVLETGKDYVRELRIEPERRIGSAITYLDSALPDLGHPSLDRALAERCTDLPKLLYRLNQDIGGVCLVYLYCHGEFDEEEFRRTSVGSLWAINFARIPPKDQDRPLFFVNACHSGRLTWGGGQASGLPEALLARVACGYIGTLGPVEEKLATEVATTLLNQAIEGPEPMYPAESLRRLRRDALEARKMNPADKGGMARFLNAFMYVYYGNPLACFKLRLPPSPGGGS